MSDDKVWGAQANVNANAFGGGQEKFGGASSGSGNTSAGGGGQSGGAAGDSPSGGSSGADSGIGFRGGFGAQRQMQRPVYAKKQSSSSSYTPEDYEKMFNERIEKGEFFEAFFEQKVKITKAGRTIFEEMKHFNQLDFGAFGEQMARNVKRAGYTRPTPIQQSAVPLIIDGEDLLACSETGSGKTAAFLLPIMAKILSGNQATRTADDVCAPRCIVIAPSRELAQQIFREALKLAAGTEFTVEVVYGGTSIEQQRLRLETGPSMLVCTIGRLLDFVKSDVIDLSHCDYLVLDDADRLLASGFDAGVWGITDLLMQPGVKPNTDRQTLMFSATFAPVMQKLAEQILKQHYCMITVGTVDESAESEHAKIGVANKCIHQEIYACDGFAAKKAKLMELLGIDLTNYALKEGSTIFMKKTLVFVTSRKKARTLGNILSDSALPTTVINGDLTQKEREMALRAFRLGHFPILIATGVAERGLDIVGIDHVINFDMPTIINDYIQRIGRTGRVGNPGRATSFFDPRLDAAMREPLKLELAKAQQYVPPFLLEEAIPNDAPSGGNEDNEVW